MLFVDAGLQRRGFNPPIVADIPVHPDLEPVLLDVTRTPLHPRDPGKVRTNRIQHLRLGQATIGENYEPERLTRPPAAGYPPPPLHFARLRHTRIDAAERPAVP